MKFSHLQGLALKSKDWDKKNTNKQTKKNSMAFSLQANHTN
jgi:hypothetical protein